MSSQLASLDHLLWARGASVALPDTGVALPWALRGLEPALVVVPHRRAAKELCADLDVLEQEALFLDEPPLVAQDLKNEETWLRRGALWDRWQCQGGLLVTTPGALVVPMSRSSEVLELTCGRTVGRDSFIQWLASRGYQRRNIVWERGDFAVRGSIVDFFDPTSDGPLRVQFFDEDVEDLRRFHVKTQRSYEALTSCLIGSARADSQGRRDLDLAGQFRCVFVAPRQLEASFTAFAELWNPLVSERLRLEENRWESVLLSLSSHGRLRIVSKGESAAVEPDLLSPPFFKGDLRYARSWVSTMEQSGFSVHIASRSLSEGSSLSEGAHRINELLSGGVIDGEDLVVWLTDADLFGLSERVSDQGGTLPVDLEHSLMPGQWLVHEDYGLCRFIEASHETFGRRSYETLVLGFADEKKLIIPFLDLYKLDLWDGDGEPQADRLGSRRWKNARAKAEQQIAEEAEQLLTLYATRALAPGRSFRSEGLLSRAFEKAFIYRETRDQLVALEEIGRDMESPWPMDRLLVGEVGYGKTEVALRSALKAIESGAQVALVTPTTVLAQQHYRTCLARFGDLPVRTALLSRMVSPSQQKRIRADVAQGAVDLLIGTHRIFRSDVAFHDLGLLIIDEEHRFGVKHKEALRQRYPSIDVLSLSATPIPRSLSMAFRGIKDISEISTAPASRGQVYTVTGRYNDRLVHHAIERELQRGGQVYYVHNRVEDIEQVARRLRDQYAEVSVAVAHGQMAEGQLETVMEQFYCGKVQILVCTTIVESGLDVPRANTLLVDDVRALGLAQMHQIRGRIGRRNDDGYAYFLYPGDDGSLPGATLERLEALGAVESQNSGFQLAKRDMEIRGAGEILGSSQHGFRERIGFSLYFRKLRERVAQLRGEITRPLQITRDLPLNVPEDYLPQLELRIGIYRRLASGLSLRELDDLRDELLDRCGPLPEVLEVMMAVALLRREGSSHGLLSLHCGEAVTTLSCSGDCPDGFVPRGTKYLGPGGHKGILTLARWLSRRCDGSNQSGKDENHDSQC